MNILLVNGYQKHDFCKGELNFSLYNIFLNKLRLILLMKEISFYGLT